MRRLIILYVLAISLLILSQTAIVSAATFTKEFRDIGQSYSPTDRRFAIDVKATIETDNDGTWLKGNSYLIKYEISLTYVNETLFDLDSFTIHCYESKALEYQTDVTFQNSGELTFNITADNLVGTLGIDQGFSDTVYNKNNVITGGSWFPSMYDEPIRVQVVNSPTSTPANLLSGLSLDQLFVAMILVFTIILIAVAVVAYKIGKKKKY